MGLSDILLPDDNSPDFGSIAMKKSAFGPNAGSAESALPLIEKYESGGRNILQQVVDPKISTASGYYQITNSTWKDVAPKVGIDTSQYPTAMSAPRDIQQKAASRLYNERGFEPWSSNKALMGTVRSGGYSAPSRSKTNSDDLSYALDTYERQQNIQDEAQQQAQQANALISDVSDAVVNRAQNYEARKQQNAGGPVATDDMSQYRAPLKKFIPPTENAATLPQAQKRITDDLYRKSLQEGVWGNQFGLVRGGGLTQGEEAESPEEQQKTSALESDLLRGQAIDDLKRGQILRGALGMFDARIAEMKSRGSEEQAGAGFITGLAKSIPLVREGMQSEGDVFGFGISDKEKQAQSRNVLNQDAQRESGVGQFGSEVGSLVGSLAQLALVGSAHPSLSPGGVFVAPSVPGRIVQSAEAISEGQNPLDVVAKQAVSAGIQYATGELLGPAAQAGASVFRQQASKRVGAAFAQAGLFGGGAALDEAVQSGKIDPLEVGKQAAMGAIFGMMHAPEMPEAERDAMLRRGAWDTQIPDAIIDAHPVPVTEEMIAPLKESGAVPQDATPDSFSPEQLQHIRKGEVVSRLVDNLKANGGDAPAAITETGKSFGMEQEKADALLQHPDIAQYIAADEPASEQIQEPNAEQNIRPADESAPVDAGSDRGTEAEAEPAQTLSQEDLSRKFQSAFNLPKDQADAASAIADARAETWAKENSTDKSEWYKTRIADVVKGGTPGEGALYQGKDAPAFYSALEKFIESSKQEKFTPEQLKGMLANAPGIKAEEVNLHRLDQLFNNKKTITKDEILSSITNDGFALSSEASDNRYSQYSLPGGENYQEHVITLPGIGYESPHYGAADYLAHARTTDRTIDGKKTLFIEEVQSDLHQKGRESGYLGKGERQSLFDEESRISDEISKMRQGAIYEKDLPKYNSLGEQLSEIRKKISRLDDAPPDAPFKKTWHELVMKKMLDKAAREGYDQVAWTSGDVQNERYDLSKQVDEIGYQDNGNSTYDLMVKKDGRGIGLPNGTNTNDLSIEKVSDFVGKDIADKIRNHHAQEWTDGKITQGTLKGVNLKIGGSGMKDFYDKMLPYFANKYLKKYGIKTSEVENVSRPFSTEGWSVSRKYLKSHGQVEIINDKGEPVVGRTPVPKTQTDAEILKEYAEDQSERNRAVDNKYLGTHIIPITSELRSDILEKGQPLFQGEKASVEFLKDNRAIIRGLQSPDISSAVHELGHVFRRDLTGDDLGVTEKWAGVKDGKWETEHEEKFARGFERYLRDGEAPTSKLADVFGKFKNWLTGIYKRIKGSDIDIKVSPEIKRVFDNLLGKEKENATTAGTERGNVDQGTTQGEDLRSDAEEARQGNGQPPGDSNSNAEQAQEEVAPKAGLEFKTTLRTPKEIQTWRESHPDFPINDGSSAKAIRDYAIQNRIPTTDEQGNKLGLATLVNNIRNAVDAKELEKGQAQTVAPATENEAEASPATTPSELSTSGTLQSVVVPGLSEFINTDIAPKYGSLKNAAKRIASVVAPRSQVKREQLDMVMRMKGDYDLEAAKMSKLSQMISKRFADMPESEHIAFLDRVAHGEKQPNKELQFIADLRAKIDAQDYEAWKGLDPSADWIDNHNRVLWKVIPGKPDAQGASPFKSNRPIEGSKGFMKRKTLADVSEGLARGGELVTTNPWDMFMRAHEDVTRFVTARRMINEAKEIGALKFYRNRSDVPEGYAPINDKVAKVYFKTGDGDLVKAGEWYADEGLARLLNNHLGSDALRATGAGKGLFWIKNHYTGIELAASPFHAVFETVESIIQKQASGLTRIWNLGIRQGEPSEIFKGLGEFGTSLAAPLKLAHEGALLKNYIEQRYMTPDAREFKRLQNEKSAPIIQTIKNAIDARKYLGVEKFENKYVKDHVDDFLSDIFSGGIDMVGRDYSTSAKNSLRQASAESFAQMEKGNPIGAMTRELGVMMRLLPAINQTIMDPLFKEYIPRLKLGGMLNTYSQSLQDYAQEIAEGKVTPGELARKAWDQMENSFGEMNFDNLFWNKTFKSSLQLMFRSVTWKGGTARQIFSGLSGQGKELFDFIAGLKPGNKGYFPRLDPRMSWLLSMSFTTALMGTITQKFLAGVYPWETNTPFKDLIYPRTDKEGRRLNPFTYARDIIGFAKGPMKYFEHSAAGVYGKMLESYHNEDYYGAEVYNPDDDVMTKGWEMIKHMAPAPIGLMNMSRAMKEDASARTKILTDIGFSYAPASIERSKFENWAHNLSQRKRGTASPEERKEQEQRFEVRKALSQSKEIGDDAYNRAKEIAKEHDISPSTFSRYIQEGDKDDIERMTDNLSPKQLEEGMAFASPEERKNLLPIMEDKINSSKSLTESAKDDLRQKYGFEKPELTRRQRINEMKKERLSGRMGGKDEYDKEILWKKMQEEKRARKEKRNE